MGSKQPPQWVTRYRQSGIDGIPTRRGGARAADRRGHNDRDTTGVGHGTDCCRSHEGCGDGDGWCLQLGAGDFNGCSAA